jgi:tryptophan synthase beta chain
VIAAEPAACPTLTKGTVAYDYGDSAGLTPLFRMHTLGHGFVPPTFHAGGLRAHGMGQMVSRVVEDGLMEATAVTQRRCFEGAVQFARAEGILPAPESTHAIRVAIDEALRCKAEGRSQTILFGLSGHGHFDLTAYERYFAGELDDTVLDDEAVAAARLTIPAQSWDLAGTAT